MTIEIQGWNSVCTWQFVQQHAKWPQNWKAVLILRRESCKVLSIQVIINIITLKKMLLHVYSPLNCFIIMFNYWDNKTTTQSNCMPAAVNALPCLPSFDIIFHLNIYFTDLLLLHHFNCLKDAVCMKHWIPPMSCSFRLT